MLIDPVQDRFWNSAKKLRRKQRRKERFKKYFASWFLWTDVGEGCNCCKPGQCKTVTIGSCEAVGDEQEYCIDETDWGSGVKYFKNYRNGRCYYVDHSDPEVDVGDKKIIKRSRITPVSSCDSCITECGETGSGCPDGDACFGGCEGSMPVSMTITFAGVEACESTRDIDPTGTYCSSAFHLGPPSPFYGASCDLTINGTYTGTPDSSERCGDLWYGGPGNPAAFQMKRLWRCQESDMCEGECMGLLNGDWCSGCDDCYECGATEYLSGQRSYIEVGYTKQYDYPHVDGPSHTGWQVNAHWKTWPGGGMHDTAIIFFGMVSKDPDECYETFTVANDLTTCRPWDNCKPTPNMRFNRCGSCNSADPEADPPDLTPVDTGGVWAHGGTATVEWYWS